MATETEDDALEASGLDGVRGEFWIDGGSRVAGTVHYRDGELRIVTEGSVRTSRMYRSEDGGPNVRVMSMSGDPADGVADFAPVPMMGALDDGRSFTVVDGRLAPGIPFESQTLTGARVLLGVHAATVATTFTAARVALPQPELWSDVLSVADPLEVRIGERVGTLRAHVDSGEGWLELTLGDGIMEREWERRFWGRVVTLLRLWTHAAVREARVQLSPGVEGWVDLVHAGTKRSESTSRWGSLLPPESLTLDVVGRALTLFDELAPVPDVASKHMAHEATLELAVLANAAALEGLHRGTPGGVVPFPAVKEPRPIAKEAAEAAARAMAAQGLLDGEDVEAAVTRLTDKSFSFFNQPTFAERLRELLPPVEGVAPGLIGHDRDAWVRDVKQARNMEAHRFPRKPAERAKYRQRVDDYYVLATSTDWVLRIALLLRLGVPSQLLHARLLDHQPFEYALANMDYSEDPPGSRLAEFRASRPQPPAVAGTGS